MEGVKSLLLTILFFDSVPVENTVKHGGDYLFYDTTISKIIKKVENGVAN
jgi:hypothetical protein